MAEPSRDNLPFAAVPSDEKSYYRELLGFCNEAVQQGDAFLRSQRGYEKCGEAIDSIMSIERNPRATPLSSIQANHIGKIGLDLAASLTDTKPFWEYRTPPGSSFEKTADNLGRLSQHWYLQRFIDMRQADVIKYSLACGAGVAHITWNPRILDQDVSAEDPRDVLPISPVDMHTYQSALGVVIRRSRVPWYIRQNYGVEVDPDKDGSATQAGQSSRVMKLLEKLGGSPFWDVLTKQKPVRQMPRIPTVDEYVMYFHDDRRNEKSYPVQIGEFTNEGKPANNWSYIVEPGEQLYPRGRMVAFCKTYPKPLYDGPNMYWHGMFPTPKLILDPWPWSWLGKGALWDPMALQGTLNRLLRVVEDQVEKIARPNIIADKNSISEGAMNKLDTRRAGLKIRFNPMSGKGVEIPRPDSIDQSIMQLIGWTVATMEKLAGTSDMGQVMKLNQLPSDDTISKITEQMSAAVRSRSRAIEAYVREFATMAAFNFFQFYTEPMWLQVVGPYGVTPEWFDFDPGTFLPAYIHSSDFDERGIPTREALDRGPLPRFDRAKELMRSMAYQIAPGSLLAASEVERKLLYLQLSRAGLIDHWTLLEVLGIPNVGEAPAGTITERLQAEMAMGLGMAASAAGRKASGQKMPRNVTKES